MEPYVGEIRLFAGTFAPLNWNLCDGSLLSISQYSTLYALIGTTYGGDGQNTFGVPDLRGRLPVGQGQGPGLTPRTIGELSGTEQVTLTTATMPAHSHGLIAQATAATSEQPTDSYFAEAQDGGLLYLDPTGIAPADAVMATNVIGAAGGNTPHYNLMPALASTYIIALEGIFPSRA